MMEDTAPDEIKVLDDPYAGMSRKQRKTARHKDKAHSVDIGNAEITEGRN